jgi:6-phosphofructokinase 2
MIYTITQSPALNRTVEVEEIIYDDVNEVIKEKNSIGGKGIDISRVIKELGGESVALGFNGGYNGIEAEGRLVNEGILCDFTRINDEIRSNIIIYQRKKNVQTLLSTCGPEIKPFEVSALYNKVKEVPSESYVVLGGSMPKGMSDNFFAQLITTLKEKNVKVVLDADEEILARGLKAGPFLIKPNIHEFGRLINKNIGDIEDIFEEAKPYLSMVDYIVVSAGARGVVGVSREGNYHVLPPKVKVRSSLGAGDSLVAGIVYVLSKGGSFEESLALGVACGTASTLNPGNMLCTKEDIDIIKKDVIIKKF